MSDKLKAYCLSLFFSLISYPLFFKLYQIIFQPIMIGGNLFRMFPLWFEKFFVTFIFALYFYLAFFVFLLVKKDAVKVWLWGAAIPLLWALLGGLKELFWAIILSFLGWLLAQGGLMIYKKIKTKNPS